MSHCRIRHHLPTTYGERLDEKSIPAGESFLILSCAELVVNNTQGLLKEEVSSYARFIYLWHRWTSLISLQFCGWIISSKDQ